jgi:4,5:9,10-diseco-3-hydroxy-5,9,17-trioxoandrosta-1(10),2-diene-4-oate hydrolase
VKQFASRVEGIARGFLAMTQKTSEPRFEEAFVDVVGARVYYLHAGSGKPMLLIHGLVGSSANWRNNIAALAQHASVYAIDLVNMGKSQRVGGLDAGLTATANRVAAVMNALNLAEADIVAHSHGGAVALMLAALHPSLVRRLILFAPANPYSRASDVMVRIYSTTWGRMLAWMLPYLPTPIQRIALGQMYGGADRVLDKCLQEIIDNLRSTVTLRHVLCVIRCWCAEMAILKAAICRVKRTPTLLVWGDRDYTVSLSSAIQLKRRLRASELIVLPGGGHSVFEETPEESNRIMLEWLGRQSSSTPRLRHLPRATSADLNQATNSKSARIDLELRQSLHRDSLELRKLTG